MYRMLLLAGVVLAGCGGVQEPEAAGDPGGTEPTSRELSDAVHEPLERSTSWRWSARAGWTRPSGSRRPR